MKTGRVILLFEVGEIVEEITELVGSSDEIGKTYIIGTDSTGNRTFIKKKEPGSTITVVPDGEGAGVGITL